jgi:hypothetical protein
MPTLISRTCASLISVIAVSTALIAQNVPMSAPIQLTHGKPFVMVMVNDKGPFRFVVDTGTGSKAFISAELADELHLPESGYVHLSDPSKQGGQRVPLVTIHSLQVAGVVFTEIRAARHTFSSADGNCDGLLGFELFRDYLLTLDYPHRSMALASGSLTPDGGQSVLPFRKPDGIPIIPMYIGDIQIDAQIDSGGTGLSLPETLVSKLKFISNPEVFGRAQSLSTRFKLRAARLASDVHLGNYTFTQPFVEIGSAFPLANFGASAMQNFAFTFDQKNGLVRFESAQQTLRISVTSLPMRVDREPVVKSPDISLAPVG